MATIDFDFEELPLIIEGGWEAGLVNGSAQITFRRDGSWGIDNISLDGFKSYSVEQPLGGWKSVYDNKPVSLDAGTPIFLAIYHRLEHEWRGKVQEAVNEAIPQIWSVARQFDSARNLLGAA